MIQINDKIKLGAHEFRHKSFNGIIGIVKDIRAADVLIEIIDNNNNKSVLKGELVTVGNINLIVMNNKMPDYLK